MCSLSFRYDMLGLAENVDDYDYGLKSALEHLNDDILPKDNNSSSESAVKQDQETTNKENEEPKPGSSKEGTTAVKKSVPTLPKIPEDAFLMVTQVNWEEDVVWNGDDIRNKVMQKHNSKSNMAG